MKVGDMVKLDPEYYPREENYVGVLIAKVLSKKCNGKPTTNWVIMMRDRIHQYCIDQEDMELVDESR